MVSPSTEPTSPSITSVPSSMRAYAPMGTWQPPSSLRMTTRSAVTHVNVSTWLILSMTSTMNSSPSRISMPIAPWPTAETICSVGM